MVNLELTQYIREELKAEVLGSQDVTGMMGNPRKAAYFWEKVGNGEISFAYEGIAFLHNLQIMSLTKNPEIDPKFVGWHGRIGKNDKIRRPVSDKLKIGFLDKTIAPTEDIIQHIEKSGKIGYVNIHEPEHAHLNGAAALLEKAVHAHMLFEGDFGNNSSWKAGQLAWNLGNRSGVVLDLGHAAKEFDSFKWETDYHKIIGLLFQVWPTIVHIPVGTVFDGVPRNLPGEFYRRFAAAKRIIGFVPEIETQMGDLWSSIYRSKRSLSHFVSYIQDCLKPWAMSGIFKKS